MPGQLVIVLQSYINVSGSLQGMLPSVAYCSPSWLCPFATIICTILRYCLGHELTLACCHSKLYCTWIRLLLLCLSSVIIIMSTIIEYYMIQHVPATGEVEIRFCMDDSGAECVLLLAYLNCFLSCSYTLRTIKGSSVVPVGD